MTRLGTIKENQSNCRDCLYLIPLSPEDGVPFHRVAMCGVQGNVNSMIFTAAELKEQRHPRGACEGGCLDGKFDNSRYAAEVCSAYHSKGTPEELAHFRRAEMDARRKTFCSRLQNV